MPTLLAEADYGQLIAIAVVLISTIIGSLNKRDQAQKKRQQQRRQRSGPGRGAPEPQRHTAKVPQPTRPEPMPTRPQPMPTRPQPAPQQRPTPPPQARPPAPRPIPRVEKPAAPAARPAQPETTPEAAPAPPAAVAHRGKPSGRSLAAARFGSGRREASEPTPGEVVEPVSPEVTDAIRLLQSRRGLRTAMIIGEIFDEPLALRGPRQ